MKIHDAIREITKHYGIEIDDAEVKKIANWVLYKFSKMAPPRESWENWKEECHNIACAALVEAAAKYNPYAKPRIKDECEQEDSELLDDSGQDEAAERKVPFRYWAYENLQRRFVENWKPDFTLKDIEVEIQPQDMHYVMTLLNLAALVTIESIDWLTVVLNTKRLNELNKFLERNYFWNRAKFVKRKGRKSIYLQVKKEGETLCLKGECRRVVDCSSDVSDEHRDMSLRSNYEDAEELETHTDEIDDVTKLDLLIKLHKLPRQHRRVILNWFGLYEYKPKNATEIAELIGYTPTTVHILKQEALTALSNM